MLGASLVSGQTTQFSFDANGNFLLQAVENVVAPKILSQPQFQVVAPGALASIFVVAANTSGLSYQWRFAGANITGATSDTLLLQNVRATNEGQYSVVLVNSSGSITSAPAALWLDGDGDGLPDSWELTYLGNLTNTTTGDFDGDGVSNLAEFLEDTNPADNASLLYWLTLVSDGGQVTVNPSRFTFTNGEVVTLTATASPPNSFHGWTGATNTTANPISLTMNGNKTVFANLGSYAIVWTNRAGGDWHVASNWSPNFVPATNDDVFIQISAAVTLNSNAAIGSLTLGAVGISPTLTGGGTLTVSKASFWSGGFMTGSGRTIISPDATLTINPASAVTLSGGRTLENGGTVLWAGAGTIFISNAVITNRANAVVEAQTAEAMTPPTGAGPSRFDNAGTFRKTSAGTTTVGSLTSFNNYNTVEIQSGALLLSGGGVNNGTMEMAAGTTLNLAGGTFISSAGASIAGAGNLTLNVVTATLAGLVNVGGMNTFDGGTANLTGNYICTNNTLILSGGTANFNGTGTVTPALLNQDGGALGGGQMVTVLSQMNWSGGTMTGSGRTIIPPGVTLNIINTVSLTGGRTLENGGTLLWTGGNIGSGNAVVITNRPGALFEVRNAAGLNYTANASSRFDNAGTFRKSVNAGTTTVFPGMTFNNYNTVEIQAGTLALSGGGTHSGAFDVAAGTTLHLSGGTHTASLGSSITGAGNLTLNVVTATLAGLVNVGGMNTFDGGTANLTGNYICTNNTLILSGGTANFNGTGTVTPALLNQDGGALGGGQMVTVLSQMNWSGGTMTGSGRTIIPPGVTLNIINTVSLTGGRTLENGGTLLWTGGNIGSGNAVVITNRPGALFEVRNAAGLNYTANASSRFDNAGTFRKSVNAGTTTVFTGMAFNNYGTVEIRSGILAVNGGYTSSAGALLNCAIGGTTVGTGYGRLQVAGTVILNGALGVNLINGFLPATNDSFTVVTAGTRNGAFTSFSYPSNIVTMQMSNTANSVIVRVTGVAPPNPVLLVPTIAGTNLVLTWTAVSNTAYRIEFKSDLNATNWDAVPGDVTSLSNRASKVDALTSSNRFYRVRLNP